MGEGPQTLSRPRSPGCQKAQKLGSLGKEPLFSCWRPRDPCLLAFLSLVLSAHLLLGVSLFVGVRPCLHPGSLCLVPVLLCGCLCLLGSLLCSDCFWVCVFLSGFFLLFSLVFHCLTVSVSYSFFLGFCLSACLSLPLSPSLSLFFSLPCVSLYLSLISYLYPSIHPSSLPYPPLLGFSCPPAINFKGDPGSQR